MSEQQQPPYPGPPQPQPGHPYPGQLSPRPAAPPPPGADYPGRTLGIVGLIVAIFANVIGIVISAIALDQSKRAGFRNGPAKAGVIVGSVLLGTGLLVGLVFAVIGITLGLTAALTVPFTGGQGAPYTAAPNSPSDPSAPPGIPFDGTPLEYSVGDCFMEPTADMGHVQFVDCATPHDYEVYADFEVPDTADGSYPGDDRMSIAADSGCRDAYADFTGVPWEDSEFDYAFIAPDDGTWSGSDDRLVSCAIYDPAGPTTGSLEGVGR